MRVSLKPTTLARLLAFESDFQTKDVNELIQNALTELVSLRRLTAPGVCRFVTADPVEPALGEGRSAAYTHKADTAPSIAINELSGLLSD